MADSKGVTGGGDVDDALRWSRAALPPIIPKGEGGGAQVDQRLHKGKQPGFRRGKTKYTICNNLYQIGQSFGIRTSHSLCKRVIRI